MMQEFSEVISKIKELYGIDVINLEKIAKGFLSENHILSDGTQKYFLKKYRFDNKERVEEIHRAKKYFADGGIPVILPILNKEGSAYFSVGDEYFAIFPYVVGRQIEKDIPDTAIVSLGEMLGKIHLLGKDAKLDIAEQFKEWNKEKTLAKYEVIETLIHERKELDDFDKLALEDLEMRKSLIEANTINFTDLDLKNDHLIHGDYHTENVFFDDHDHVSYVFDWEKAGYASRMYELIRSLVLIYFTESFDSKNLPKAKLYLESYLSVYPTSETLLRNGFKLYYLKQLHSSWVQNEHYVKKNYRVDQFLSMNHKRIKYLSEHLEEMEDSLFN